MGTADSKKDVLHVEGGKPLSGTIKVRGAKNLVSKAMVAALLAPGTSVLKNVPEIRDVSVVSDLLRLHGVDVNFDGENGIVAIDATKVYLADVATWIRFRAPAAFRFCFPVLWCIVWEKHLSRLWEDAISGAVPLTSIWRLCASLAPKLTKNIPTAFI